MPVGLDPRTPWIVSCSSMLATTREAQMEGKYMLWYGYGQASEEHNVSYYVILRLCLLTNQGLQGVLYAFDELAVNLDG